MTSISHIPTSNPTPPSTSIYSDHLPQLHWHLLGPSHSYFPLGQRNSLLTGLPASTPACCGLLSQQPEWSLKTQARSWYFFVQNPPMAFHEIQGISQWPTGYPVIWPWLQSAHPAHSLFNLLHQPWPLFCMSHTLSSLLGSLLLAFLPGWNTLFSKYLHGSLLQNAEEIYSSRESRSRRKIKTKTSTRISALPELLLIPFFIPRTPFDLLSHYPNLIPTSAFQKRLVNSPCGSAG